VKFTSSSGSGFKLEILGYQFPHLETEEYDSNWLIIKTNVTHPERSWTSRGPDLLTYEIAELADWLVGIAHGQAVNPVLRFIEPNLEFRLLDLEPTRQLLRIYFELESRPDWASQDKGIMEDLWVEFPIPELDLEEAVRSLRQQLSKYPQRAKR